MGQTSIEWTDRSVNPIRARLRDAAHAGVTKGGYASGVGHYCEKISAGCANCYSSTTQARFGMPVFPGVGKGEPSVEPFFDESKLREVLSCRKPQKWFWCDMTDMFGRWVPDEWIDRCFATMALTPHHVHQVLTKRPERMAEYLAYSLRAFRVGFTANKWWDDMHGEGACLSLPDMLWPLPNVWLGTSPCNQKTADESIPHLLRCPAAVRFLSCEPLIGPVDLVAAYNAGAPGTWTDNRTKIGVDWVIVGGESGPGSRPMNVEWARSIVRQCKAAGVPVFCKQMGSVPALTAGRGDSAKQRMEDEARQEMTWPDGTSFGNRTGKAELNGLRVLLRDKKGGDPQEWPEDLRVREMPTR